MKNRRARMLITAVVAGCLFGIAHGDEDPLPPACGSLPPGEPLCNGGMGFCTASGDPTCGGPVSSPPKFCCMQLTNSCRHFQSWYQCCRGSTTWTVICVELSAHSKPNCDGNDVGCYADPP